MQCCPQALLLCCSPIFSHRSWYTYTHFDQSGALLLHLPFFDVALLFYLWSSLPSRFVPKNSYVLTPYRHHFFCHHARSGAPNCRSASSTDLWFSSKLLTHLWSLLPPSLYVWLPFSHLLTSSSQQQPISQAPCCIPHALSQTRISSASLR